MCIFYALILMAKTRFRGRWLIQLKPFHVLLAVDGRLYHGTNRSGKWAIESVDPRSYQRWLTT